MRVIAATDPNNPERIPILEDMKSLNRSGRGGCVSAMIRMLADLRENGQASRYLKHLGGRLYELKTRTPVGGARVYFFVLGGVAYLCRAECKREDKASAALLDDTAAMLEAYRE